ncbi:MAG: response regulator, partial [Acidimicrobiia bacterium]
MSETAARTVLVVDDESDIRTLCKVNLEYEGYRVTEARGGTEALEMVQNDRPNVILLDLMMPGVDGWDVLERLQSDDSTAKIPVILLTALADEESQLRGWAEGILDYITKPFNPLSLPRYVADALIEK